jgi:hypothetical protein
MAEHTTPDTATTDEETRDASLKADGGRGPTEAEERAAEQNEPVKPSVAQANEEARKIGANIKGEGELP